MTPKERKEAMLELIAARLDAIMAERALTHAEVFLRSRGAVAPSTIGNVLRAHDHRISTLVEIAAALDCRLEINILQSGK